MLEAGYLKKPILGFRSGGITEFVTAQTGKLSAQNDVKELASYMEECRLNKIGFNAEVAHQRAAKFELSNYLPQIIEILKSL
jgi:glycosyltransferase involved in cell wall biosynthesis